MWTPVEELRNEAVKQTLMASKCDLLVKLASCVVVVVLHDVSVLVNVDASKLGIKREVTKLMHCTIVTWVSKLPGAVLSAAVK